MRTFLHQRLGKIYTRYCLYKRQVPKFDDIVECGKGFIKAFWMDLMILMPAHLLIISIQMESLDNEPVETQTSEESLR